MKDIPSPAAPNTPYFTPAQVPPAGTARNPQPNGNPVPKLFQPIKIRGSRVSEPYMVRRADRPTQLSPLGQSSSSNGAATAWHSATVIGGILIYGPGLSFMEATAVLPQGRTSPEDNGLWSDAHIEPLRTLVEFAHSQGQKIGIQLVHAGRKATPLPSGAAVGGWPDDVWAPSPIPYRATPELAVPKALDLAGVKGIVKAFADAARRAVAAGFDVIDIHGAHGYLLHEFMSPVSNKRTDQYGGSFENRIRLTVEVVDAIRAVIPGDMPLFLRVSGTEWLEEVAPDEPSWRIEDSANLAEVLVDHGVDLIDVSSAGLDPRQKIRFTTAAYQAPLAEVVKKKVGDRMIIAAVGGITNAHVAQEVLDKGQADVIMVGRHFIRDHQAVWNFAEELGVDIHLPNQVDWVFKGRGSAQKK
ncbi:hypothetical protein B0H21DRAFT_782373 [Amylocystis lapponica]|nr:hypothetical protein B0H21DRAFT_782373 [Amylocystis lapponica]